MSNFEMWKLHDLGDYLFLFALGATGALAIFCIFLKLKHGRTAKGGSNRVEKALKRYMPKEGTLLNDVVLNLAGNQYAIDHLLIDSHGILMMKRYSWGLGLFGMEDDVKWVLKDREKEERVDNPMPLLLESQRYLTEMLSKNDFYGIHFHELIILADTYDEPVSYLEKTIDAISYNNIKKKMKARKAQPVVMPNHKAIAELIQACAEKE